MVSGNLTSDSCINKCITCVTSNSYGIFVLVIEIFEKKYTAKDSWFSDLHFSNQLRKHKGKYIVSKLAISVKLVDYTQFLWTAKSFWTTINCGLHMEFFENCRIICR